MKLRSFFLLLTLFFLNFSIQAKHFIELDKNQYKNKTFLAEIEYYMLDTKSEQPFLIHLFQAKVSQDYQNKNPQWLIQLADQSLKSYGIKTLTGSQVKINTGLLSLIKDPSSHKVNAKIFDPIKESGRTLLKTIIDHFDIAYGEPSWFLHWIMTHYSRGNYDSACENLRNEECNRLVPVKNPEFIFIKGLSSQPIDGKNIECPYLILGSKKSKVFTTIVYNCRPALSIN